ncbi:MAG: TetR family transcriptional regulator [Amycolatopsis sp.]|uniref:TetR/AcrR family transcriptional regulator n=1 Tax=Amycolatopsis sp. TaxID=37632 RepID=UPI00260E68D5|nr:helix-turn-helix domain-containing protein [Amycolatopsis sp.]MCU1685751.1 TetR family transcriptional regulator [Amycolatopsis sp.]
MLVLAEQDSGKAARILAAAKELVLKRGVKGVTVAEIAERAHVAKGTVYLHWATKEDLLVGLFARDFLTAVDDMYNALTADPDLGRPHRLCPSLVGMGRDYPFVRAIQVGDADLLGVLTQHPRTTELVDRLGLAALMYLVLPVWREYGLARTDWALDDQAYAMQSLMTGFSAAANHTHILPTVTVAAPDQVIAAAVTALLGPEQASPADLRAAVDEGLRLLREQRDLVLASIAKEE